MNAELSALLRTPPTGAVVRIDDDEVRTLGALADQLRGFGWRPVTADGFVDRDGFYSAIAAALDFPPYFGRNLDALWDQLRELVQPIALILNWHSFETTDPYGATRVLGVLRQRAEAGGPAFAVVLVVGSTRETSLP